MVTRLRCAKCDELVWDADTMSGTATNACLEHRNQCAGPVMVKRDVYVKEEEPEESGGVPV